MQATKRTAMIWLVMLSLAVLGTIGNFVPGNTAAAAPAPGSGEPRVTTWEPTTGEGYAILYGTLEDEGASEVEEFGFYVGSPGYEDKEIQIEFEGRIDDNDTFKYTLSGLDDGVVYYVKAYAVNDEGEGYGDRLHFEIDKAAPKISVFTVGSRQYTLWGTAREMDLAPYIEASRTYLPIRYAAYAMGLTDEDIVWDEATRTVTLTKGGSTVKLFVGSYNIWINGIPTPMDVVPEIRAGRTFLPVAWVANAFRQTAVWDAGTATITIELR